MQHYNPYILNERYKLSLLKKFLPNEILEYMEQFIPILYLHIKYDIILLIDIETKYYYLIDLPFTINDALFTFNGLILCKTYSSVYNIDWREKSIIEIYTIERPTILLLNIISIDIYKNNYLISDKYNNIIINENKINYHKKILNCKYLSENELILVINEFLKNYSIIKYNIKTKQSELIYKYNEIVLVYLCISNGELLLCFSNNQLYYNNNLYYFDFSIKSAEFSGNNKYILLFGKNNNKYMIKVLDKITMNEISTLNTNIPDYITPLISSIDKYLIIDSHMILEIWCLETFKFIKYIYINKIINKKRSIKH